KLSGTGSGTVRLMHDGRLIAIAQANGDVLEPKIVIPT
ncbi:MAG: hypothetical protein QOK31_1841, partial [Solirubrobacteraceae bacterium]|nr:hypothetical protein [Solirubrobacteraceae bacterium]